MKPFNFARNNLKSASILSICFATCIATCFAPLTSKASITQLEGLKLKVLAIHIETKILEKSDAAGKITFPTPIELQRVQSDRTSFFAHRARITTINQLLAKDSFSEAEYHEAIIARDYAKKEILNLTSRIELRMNVASDGFANASSLKLGYVGERLNKSRTDSENASEPLAMLDHKNPKGQFIELDRQSPRMVSVQLQTNDGKNELSNLNSTPTAHTFTLTYRKGMEMGLTMNSFSNINFQFFVLTTCREVLVRDTFMTFEVPGTEETHLICSLPENQGFIRFKVGLYSGI